VTQIVKTIPIQELERFTAAYPRYNVIGDSYRNAHNIFFGWLALFGIVGFLALMVSIFLS
jgi:O-antigen ligase